MTTLSNEDKLGIANQHKRNLEYNIYNTHLSLVEEKSVSDPNSDIVNSLNNEITELNKKLTAINNEIASLTE